LTVLAEASTREAQIGRGIVLEASRLFRIAQRCYLRKKLGGMNRLQEQMEIVTPIAGILE